MAWQNRPYIDKQRPELETLAKQNWNSAPILKTIAHELGFRTKWSSIELRMEIVRRLSDLIENAAVSEVPNEVDENPGSLIQSEPHVRQELQKDFHEEPEADVLQDSYEEPANTFLEYLGYSVKDNLTEAERRRIIDDIYCQDLPSGPNSKKWGGPGSATRRLLIREILTERCRRPKKKKRPPTNRELEAWKSDLKWFNQKYF
jgi:hypothetical protein